MDRLVLLIIPAVLLLACVPEPSLDQTAYEPKLVIDGSIESGGFPRVVLSNSASYFMNIDSANIRDLIVSTAKVTVSDGETEEILTLKRDDDFFPPYVYQGTSLKGEVGKTYSLTVEVKGKRYTASTTIPPPAKFDKLWFELAPGKDSLGYVYGQLTDNAEEANYYRVFTQRLNKDNRFIPVYLSAVGDQYFNGQQFTFTILRGPENFTNVIDDLYFKRGDSVRVKLCSMDRAHFDFWRTVERELYVVGNPFSSSGNEIISNIDGDDALGVWGGYGVSFYAINIK
ncbi:DUF4249 domain-containing protein [Chryseolinea soli]|uniref:DUF4249 domain-containing protein n=1 Tax=Chryseolinea soli TaxID=2321403 RepID=A0A385SSC3_9BACT|nr:DUF4249 domain-containing protein [Chryseolinea soli]AYB33792.1 DUF4249 domain-containing protein [Chryseolinea soli]